MVVYKCDNPNCEKEVPAPDDLQKVSVLINLDVAKNDVCFDCAGKIKNLFDDFFEKKPEPAPDPMPQATEA